MSTFYDVLGLAASAEPADVRAAYHKLAKRSHPDVNVNDMTAEERFKKINQAYEILSDPEWRAAYDLGLKHKLAVAQRRFRSAMVASAACFAMTVACGLYFSLPYVGREAANTHKTERITVTRGQSSTSTAIEREKPTGVIGGSAPPSSASLHRPEREHAAQIDRRPPQPTFEKPAQKVVAAASPSSTSVAAVEREDLQTATKPPAEGSDATHTVAEPERPIVASAASGPVSAAPMPLGGREQVSQSTIGPPAVQGSPVPTADPAKTSEAIGDSGGTMRVSAADHEQALHLYAMGMERIGRGDVVAARSLFLLAARKGSVPSIRALAGTYDPAQLAQLKVLGMKSNLDAAREWYQKVGDSDAIAAAERAAREQETVDKPDEASKPATKLAQFRAAYLSGDGLAYVVVNEDAGERIYRYGDVSRSTAAKDVQAYTLFTCDTAHMLTPHKPEDLAALQKASVVRPGDVRFSEIDAKYLSSCNNPLIKSAIPKIATVREDP